MLKKYGEWFFCGPVHIVRQTPKVPCQKSIAEVGIGQKMQQVFVEVLNDFKSVRVAVF